jgi:hypothetical protein
MKGYTEHPVVSERPGRKHLGGFLRHERLPERLHPAILINVIDYEIVIELPVGPGPAQRFGCPCQMGYVPGS